MKKLWFVCLSLAFLQADDEVARIESLIQEVEALQKGYIECQEQLKTPVTSKSSITVSKELEEAKKKIEQQKEQIALLQEKLQTASTQTNDTLALKDDLQKKQQQIVQLQKQIQTLQSQKTQLEQQLQNQKTQFKLHKTQQDVKKTQKTQQKTPLPKKKILTQQKQQKEIAHEIEPSTFRTSKEASIYDSIDGKVIDKWEKGVSFTSYIASKNWIKITGYFVDRKWREAPKELWIKKSDAFKR